MLKRRSPAALLLVALLVFGGLSTPALAATPSWPPGPTQSADRVPTRSITERWIVRLADPPIAQAPQAAPGFSIQTVGAASGGRLQLDTQAAKEYRAFLEQRQTSMFAQIRRSWPAARIERRYAITFDGMS